jgi:hypothetical protein
VTVLSVLILFSGLSLPFLYTVSAAFCTFRFYKSAYYCFPFFECTQLFPWVTQRKNESRCDTE